MVVRDRTAACSAVLLAVLLGATAPASPAIAAPRHGPIGWAQPVSEESTPLHADENVALPEPDPVDEAERTAALAEPAIVVIDVRWEGYVHDRVTGELLDGERVSASTRCTGAGVGTEGYLLTTASCLDQASVADDAFRQLVERRVADGRTPSDRADEMLGELLSGAMIGSDPAPADAPERSVLVRRAVTADEAMPATVVAIADPLDGDVAVLKIDRDNQPVLPLADNGAVALGDEVVTLECPPDVGSVVGVVATTGPPADADESTAVAPRFRTGTVSEAEPQVIVEPTEPGASLPALPGAVVLTEDAAIVGLVEARLPYGDLLVDTQAIRDLLVAAEVDTDLGEVDRDYRAGLDAYYDGRYTESIERFDAVLAIIPSHVQAHEFRDAAQTLRDAEGGEPAPPDDVADRVDSWLDRLERSLNFHSGSLVGVGLLAAIIVFVVHRRRPPPGSTLPGEESPDDALVTTGGQDRPVADERD